MIIKCPDLCKYFCVFFITFLALNSRFCVGSNNDIVEFKGCPNQVSNGIYLDGGTQFIRVVAANSVTYFAGLENPTEISIPNSRAKVTEKELAYIEKHKQIRVYINGRHPNKEHTKYLSFKGDEEQKLIGKIRTWLTCNSLNNKDKENIQEFLELLKKKRIKKIVFEHDRQDRELQDWRIRNSPSNYFSDRDKFILAKVKIISVSRKTIPIKPQKKIARNFWYLVRLKVIKDFDSGSIGDEITVLTDNRVDIQFSTNPDVMAILSRVNKDFLPEKISVDYFLHELSEPETIYCFKNEIKDLNLGYTQITSRKIWHWKKQCLNNSDL